MSRSLVETVLGAVVLVVALGFLVYAYTTSDVADPGGYRLEAAFSGIGAVQTGSDVRVAGIKVGEVVRARLNEQTYQAVLELSVASDVELPLDSSARIASEGLLGGQFVELQPGAEIDMLQPGDEITFTQSAISLEDLIGRFVFSGEGEGSNPGGDGS
ncbi:MAG: outer membrane lipid asymmetry maintenance protein MlaD [Alphaproteobacteria bacterium]|jgi:phospholipid/cholesterol/gamma-HCH transport system substrate-binding protein|nr:outer membrane lipid asymmetry maintenance protein MlaD [Alphaproteobacteria bacterium]